MSFQPPYDPSDRTGTGFYSPATRPFSTRENYQEFLNSDNGTLSFQDTDAIHNLITELPLLKAENLTLAGENCVWLSRLHSGIQCPNFNELSGSCGRARCNLCYQTGYLGGYTTGVGIKISFIPGKVDTFVKDVGLTIQQRPQAWCLITYPLIQEQDIIVVYENERYVVHTAEAIELQGHRYYQELTLSRIDRMDAAYQVPIPGVVAEDTVDFVCALQIVRPSNDFAAAITINNYYFDLVPEPAFDSIIFPENQSEG